MVSYDVNDSIRTIRVKSIEEARERLFRLYGNDYNIIERRSVPKSSFFGFVCKDELEVTYTLKARNVVVQKNPEPVTSQKEVSDFAKSRDEILKKAVFANNLSNNFTFTSQLTGIEKKLEELTKKMEKPPVSSKSQDTHPTIAKIEELLSQNEFSFKYIQNMTEKIKSTFSLNELEDFNRVQRAVVDWIGESVSIAPLKVHRKPHVVIIVGPTGVGKTTTLVKLATQFLMDSKKENKTADFCFITTDTMRVGALEQLSRFGEIFGRNVLKAQTNEDVKKIYEEYKDNVDAIFIDTGGYGPQDAQHLADMKTTLSVQGLNPDIYLAVTASTKSRDLHTIMQNYEPFGYQSVIVTKCDESNQYGNVISALTERHKSISYITNGQKIRQTIYKASVIDLLKNLEGFEIDRVHIEDKFYTEEKVGEE